MHYFGLTAPSLSPLRSVGARGYSALLLATCLCACGGDETEADGAVGAGGAAAGSAGNNSAGVNTAASGAGQTNASGTAGAASATAMGTAGSNTGSGGAGTTANNASGDNTSGSDNTGSGGAANGDNGDNGPVGDNTATAGSGDNAADSNSGDAGNNSAGDDTAASGSSSVDTTSNGGSASGGSGSGDDAAGDATAGNMAQGVGGDTSAGANDDDASSDDCTRASLTAQVDAYFEALFAHDAAALSVSADVRFTENGEEMALGEGLWESADSIELRRDILEPASCGSHTHAVLREDGDLIVFGVRLKIVDSQISEVETYIARDGAFTFDPEGVLATADQAWEEILPEAERSTREELVSAADSYFTLFQDSGTDVPFGSPCDRWENGNQTTSGDCSAGIPGGLDIDGRRFPVIDVETGVAVGLVLFAGSLDFHMFKLRNGEIEMIQALVGPSVSSSGWP